MKEAGLKLDNYFQAVEKTPIFMCGLISSEKKPLNRSTNEKYGGCLLDCNGQEIPRHRLQENREIGEVDRGGYGTSKAVHLAVGPRKLLHLVLIGFPFQFDT